MDNGKENGNYCLGFGILCFLRVLGWIVDNGKENGNYYLRFRVKGLEPAINYNG